MKKILLNLMVTFTCLLLVSCEFSEDKTHIVNVTVCDTSDSFTVLDGEVFEKPQDPVVFGYEFIGWYEGDDEYDFSEKVTKNTNIVAKFRPLDYVPRWELNDTNFNGNGEVIKIMYQKKDLSEDFDLFNPFIEDYRYSDQITRQKHILAVEKAYNIDIVFETYKELDDTVLKDYETMRIPVILSISTNHLTQAEQMYDLHKYSEQMYVDNINIQQLTNGYGYNNNTLGNYFMYYNKTVLATLDLEDPASMWLKGTWTYEAFEVYLETLSNALKKGNSDYKIFNNCYEMLVAGMMNSKGNAFIPSLNETEIIDETVLQEIDNLKEWQDCGYFVESKSLSVVNQNAIFNVIPEYEEAIKYYETFGEEDMLLGVVPFPTNGNDYKMAYSKSNCYVIPKINSDTTSSAILEKIIFDLISGYNNDDYYIESQLIDKEFNKKIFASVEGKAQTDFLERACVEVNAGCPSYNCLQYGIEVYLFKNINNFEFVESKYLEVGKNKNS